MLDELNKKIHVFISYSHRDRRWLDRLKIHLTPLRLENNIDEWNDTRLTPGSIGDAEIAAAIKRADVAVLIISADFLASEFIRNNELPPLLEAAEEEGALIIPIIASPSLFHRMPRLRKFQAANIPEQPLIIMSEGEQESVFLKVAIAIQDAAPNIRERKHLASISSVSESFLEHSSWIQLLKIGDWIYDEDKKQIIGAGMHAYLLSRQQFGDKPFNIEADIEFSNFHPPEGRRLGMNAGIIIGWKSEDGLDQYYNFLFTGSSILLEKIETGKNNTATHISESYPLNIQGGKTHSFSISVQESNIQVSMDTRIVLSVPKPINVLGRVGLRPWRSQMRCTKFLSKVMQQP